MKKFSFPVMLLAAAMCSCAEDEPNMVAESLIESGDLVSINVYAGTTKGSDTTTSTLQKNGFVELHIDDSGDVSDTYTFSYVDGDWSQTDADQIKWSSIVFPANFYSMHDGTAFDNLSFIDGAATYSDYTVTGKSSEHNDLVFHASKLTAIPVGGTVSALHKHALSKIHLYAATGDFNVYIARVQLVSIDSDGTVTITPLDADADATSVGATWDTSTVNDVDYEYYYIGNGTISGLNSTENGSDPLINTEPNAPLMIIPQTTTKATIEANDDSAYATVIGSYVEVIYYMTSSTGNPLVGYSSVSARADASDYISADQTTTLYVMAGFPLGYTFEPNKEYDLKLGLGAEGSTGGKLLVDYYVDKDGCPVKLTKVDGDNEEEEVPDIDEGDDILDNVTGLIDITISVNDWDDGDSTTLEYTEMD